MAPPADFMCAGAGAAFETAATTNVSGITIATLPRLLEHDTRVKVAVVDADGMLRGKLISKSKFLSVASSGFGFSSVMFGWDMHDRTYIRELNVSNAETGYRDVVALPDLSSFRRIPWEDNVPFFLVNFLDPVTRQPICSCPRGVLKRQLERLYRGGYDAMAGGRSIPYPSRSNVR